MLIRFNVKNFLSFSENEEGKSEEFSMIAGKVRNKSEHTYDDNKIRLLKFAAVYGANAAGKSNLVRAIDFMRQTVVHGLPNGYSDKYCKADIKNKERASYFEIEIKLGGQYYAYGYEVVLSTGQFQSEWLIELTSDNREKVIFERNIVEGSYKLDGFRKAKESYEKINNYAEDIQDDEKALLLTVMNRNKKNFYQRYKSVAVLHNIYHWMKENLDINYPDRPISNYSYMASLENVEEVCNMIAAFGTGITNYQLVEVPPEKVIFHFPKEIREQLKNKLEKNMIEPEKETDDKQEFGLIMRSNRDFFILTMSNNKMICQTIQFKHNNGDVLFGLSEESDGTVRVLDLLEILLSNEGKTYVVDELDRCLHPSLTYKFIETFLQMAAKKNIQLIVTTHESRLLDFDLLRRDEIWFVNKRATGESDIYSLEEYNTRFDQKIDKAYLEGRYGGVPIFNTIFPVREESE